MYFVQLRIAPQNPKTPSRLINMPGYKSTEDFIYSLIYAMSMILLYIFAGNIIEKTQPIIGHETTVVILVSLIVTAIAIAVGHGDIIDSLVFDDDSFFYFCLPPIVFNSGFNMRRKKFFSNLGYVSVFGFIGTIIAFVSFTLLTIGAFAWIDFTYYDPVTE